MTSVKKSGYGWVHPVGNPYAGDRFDEWPFNLAADPTGPRVPTGSNPGNRTYSTNDQVIEGIKANIITVNANNVVIRDFECTGVVLNNANTNLTLEYGIIDRGGNTGNGTQFQNITHRYVEITGSEDGSKGGQNSVYESCYIHDLYNTDITHSDGIQCSGGEGIVIQDCRFENIKGSAGIFMKEDFGDVGDILIDNCFFENVGNYMIWADNNGANVPDGLTITNNVFGTQPAYLDDPPFNGGDFQRSIEATNVTWSNNILLNGTPVTL